MDGITIRPAEWTDVATLLHLIRALAEFEKLGHEVRATEADLLRAGFGPTPYFEALIVEVGGEPVGFALFFHNFSTFEGTSGLFLEDIFIAEKARGRGIGRKLMAKLAAIAVERGCARLDLSVLHWNPARSFYERLGMSHLDDWLPYRLTGSGLEALAAESEG